MLVQTKESQLPELDLGEFILEGQVNAHFACKGIHKRIKCRWVTPSVMIFEYMHYKLALYLKDVNELYRLEDCLGLHWTLIKNAIELKYGSNGITRQV
jgi:hypothetical protein